MTTYIKMVNKLLRKVNEVEVSSGNFDNVIGVTAVAKDAVVDSLDKIYNKKHKWPFMATRVTVPIAPQQTSLDFPADMLSVNWHSFIVQANDTLTYQGQWLKPMNTDEYYQYQYLFDVNLMANSAGTGGGPRHVISQPIEKTKRSFLVSPPNLYNIPLALTYTYFRKPVRPVLPDDEIDIPEEWEYVVFSRALWHMYLFYDNNERASIADADFTEGYKDMINTLLKDEVQEVYTGQISQNGPISSPSRYMR